MIGTVVRRLLSGLFLLLVAGGGGRLATADALLFHDEPDDSQPIGAHFEASSGCHDDGCSVRSTATESRSAPQFATPMVRAVAPGQSEAMPLHAEPPRPALFASHLSRAPPRLI
jgi:hypothetical protein